MRQLTDKQARFVAEYLANGENAARAYRLAYPKSTSWSENALHVEACRTLKNPLVVAAIEKARMDAAIELVRNAELSTVEQIAQVRAEAVEQVRAGGVSDSAEAPLMSAALRLAEEPLSPTERARQAFARSLEGCVQDQEKAMRLAEESGNASAFAAAAMNKAKLLGFVADRSESRNLHMTLDPQEARPDISSIWARTLGTRQGPLAIEHQPASPRPADEGEGEPPQSELRTLPVTDQARP
jgi:phage terminase small subunit